MNKTPGMLMSTINSTRTGKKVSNTMDELEDNTDEVNQYTDPDITTKIKAMEFKVKRGLTGN
jgi:hypothetical protein